MASTGAFAIPRRCGCAVSATCECESANALQPGTIALMREHAEKLNAASANAASDAAQASAATPSSDAVDFTEYEAAVDGIRAFQQLQIERVTAYRGFDSALKLLLKSGDMFTYQKKCTSITTVFSGISTQTNHISKQLRARLGAPFAAAAIDAIQEDEQTKLQLTVQLQLARVNAPPILRDMLSKCACNDVCPSCFDPVRDAIAETEMKRYAKQLAEAIDSINDKLEELRYEVADLSGM